MGQERQQILQDEHVTRASPASTVGFDELAQTFGLGTAALDRLRRFTARVLFRRLSGCHGGLDDVGIELALDLRRASHLSTDVGPDLGDLRGDFTLS